MLVGKFCSTPSAPSSLVPLLEGTMRFVLLIKFPCSLSCLSNSLAECLASIIPPAEYSTNAFYRSNTIRILPTSRGSTAAGGEGVERTMYEIYKC